MKIRPIIAAAFGVALLAGLTACAPEPPGPEPDPWADAVGQCWGPIRQMVPDLKYLGPKNTLGNGLVFYGTMNGTCGYDGGVSVAIVQAADFGAATTLCNSLGAYEAGRVPLTWGWSGASMPADGWVC